MVTYKRLSQCQLTINNDSTRSIVDQYVTYCMWCDLDNLVNTILSSETFFVDFKDETPIKTFNIIEIIKK